MKRVTPIIAALLLVTAAATRAQSQPAAPSPQPPAENPSAQPAAAPETITGRIVGVNHRAGTFKVKDSTTGKSITLKRGTLDIGSMRRGDRVTVTYSQNAAISVEPNRSGK